MLEQSKRLVDRYISVWRDLGFYERFEQIVAIFLTLVISMVIIMSSVRLAVSVVALFVGRVDPSQFAVFQTLFGMIMTVLIAVEFNHSIVQVVERRRSIIQVRVVVQIAVLAMVRKFILMDLTETAPATLYGLAAVVVALAALYWGCFLRRAPAARAAFGGGRQRQLQLNAQCIRYAETYQSARMIFYSISGLKRPTADQGPASTAAWARSSLEKGYPTGKYTGLYRIVSRLPFYDQCHQSSIYVNQGRCSTLL